MLCKICFTGRDSRNHQKPNTENLEAAEQRHHASQESCEHAPDGVRMCEMGWNRTELRVPGKKCARCHPCVWKRFHLRMVSKTKKEVPGLYKIYAGIYLIWSERSKGKRQEARDMKEGCREAVAACSLLGAFSHRYRFICCWWLEEGTDSRFGA